MSNPLQSLLAGTRRGMGSLKVVMATGLYKTAAGVQGARLLKENGEALRAYLTIHLRTGKAAQNALLAIEDTVEHGSSGELTKGPSRRSALYLLARNHVEYEGLFGEGANVPLAAVPWEATPPGRPEGWGRALDEVRFSLGADEAELLELHIARDLNVDELAYVLSAPKDEIERKLEAGRAYAKLLLEDVLGDAAEKHLPQVVKEAFAVAPPTPEELAAAKPAVVPLPPGTVIGERYEIESRLGGGACAVGSRARDVRVPGHVVALKLLHRVARPAAAREGALRELSLIASAFHPSLVHFKEHGWFEDRLWFVMPFYEGESLLDRRERGPRPLDAALAHFERLARGLAALHTAGIRHQDVKPENIYLVELATGGAADRRETLPILLDLGVATPTGDMALAGTPMYFPPEVAARIFDEECAIPITPKADVFALALSLLHSIEDPDLSELEDREVDDFLETRAKAPPSGPRLREHAFLRPYFARWLAAHPNDRPTAGQLAEDLAELRDRRLGRRRIGAPRGLRGAIVGLALSALVCGSALVADVRPREVRVVERTEVGTLLAPDPEPTESERERRLRRRLEVEQRRNFELEQTLGRLRRGELGVPAPSSPPASSSASSSASQPPSPAPPPG